MSFEKLMYLHVLTESDSGWANRLLGLYGIVPTALVNEVYSVHPTEGYTHAAFPPLGAAKTPYLTSVCRVSLATDQRLHTATRESITGVVPAQACGR